MSTAEEYYPVDSDLLCDSTSSNSTTITTHHPFSTPSSTPPPPSPPSSHFSPPFSASSFKLQQMSTNPNASPPQKSAVTSFAPPSELGHALEPVEQGVAVKAGGEPRRRSARKASTLTRASPFERPTTPHSPAPTTLDERPTIPETVLSADARYDVLTQLTPMPPASPSHNSDGYDGSGSGSGSGSEHDDAAQQPRCLYDSAGELSSSSDGNAAAAAAAAAADAPVVGLASASSEQLKWQLYKEDSWFPLLARSDSTKNLMLAFVCTVDKGVAQCKEQKGVYINHHKTELELTIAVTRPPGDIFVLTPEGTAAKAAELRFGLHAMHCENETKLVSVTKGIEKAKSALYGSRPKKGVKTFPLPSGDLAASGSSGDDNAAAGIPSLHTIKGIKFDNMTAFNIRKKGKTNPNQKYFALVATLYARVKGGLLPIAVHRSAPIIVRAAANPAVTRPDKRALRAWVMGPPAHLLVDGQKATAAAVDVHGSCGTGAGAQPGQKLFDREKTCNTNRSVGINCFAPEEALHVHGNVKLSGEVFRPSDKRVKTGIEPTNTAQQLANIKKVGIYHYNLTEEWAEHVERSNDDRACVGVLAQELQAVLPDAIKETGANYSLSDGTEIDNFLTVDYDRLHTEAIGAVKELAALSASLEVRMEAARNATLVAAKKLAVAAHTQAAMTAAAGPTPPGVASQFGWGCAFAVAAAAGMQLGRILV